MKSENRRQEMEHLLAEQAASGQTKKAFCASRQINPATFYYWQRRLREGGATKKGFEQLRLLPSLAEIKLTLPGGTCLTLSSGDVTALAALVCAIDRDHA